MTNIHTQPILILDFGSQYTQLIARRVREIGAYSIIHPFNITIETIQQLAPSGIILSGGPDSTRQESNPRVTQALFDLGIPVLGICYGMQAIAAQLGGEVDIAERHEYGYAQVKVVAHCPLLDGISDHIDSDDGHSLLDVWMSHGDHVTALPDGFVTVASTASCPIAAIYQPDKNFYGVQFHPEVSHTLQGMRILEHFVRTICDCPMTWHSGAIIDDCIASIRQQVGNDKVLLGLSGGVDSSVVAALLQRAIGDQLVAVFVDNGLLRQNEGDQVMELFEQHCGMQVIRVDATEVFLDKLVGMTDPEQKRRIIGHTFIEVFDAEAAKLAGVKWLAQGTIYPDVIESAAGSGQAQVIKSHHNVGGLPDDMAFQLVEPLRELFKDEVRNIGLELGLPHDRVFRHPFPGPGLAVRILGEVKKSYADCLRLADAIFIEELQRSGWYDKTSQAFAVFLPVKSVGVVGDARRYAHVIALRAVQTVDFMTARWAHLPYELLEKVSNRIINEVPDVSRVTYDISGKPPATIEWE